MLSWTFHFAFNIVGSKNYSWLTRTFPIFPKLQDKFSFCQKTEDWRKTSTWNLWFPICVPPSQLEISKYIEFFYLLLFIVSIWPNYQLVCIIYHFSSIFFHFRYASLLPSSTSPHSPISFVINCFIMTNYTFINEYVLFIIYYLLFFISDICVALSQLDISIYIKFYHF